MFVSKLQLRVRYGETDQMGVVYHGNYATYFEVARAEALRDSGFTYKQFEESGIFMPVISLTCNFKKPAKYDDLITVTTMIKKMPDIRIIFDYEIYCDDFLLATGNATLVFIDAKTNKPVVCPKPLEQKLLPYFS